MAQHMQLPISSSSRKAWRVASQLLTHPDGGGPTSAFSASRLMVAAGLALTLLQGCAGRIYHNPEEDPQNWDCVPVQEMASLRSDLSWHGAEQSLLNKTIRDYAVQSGLDVCVYSPSQQIQAQPSSFGADAFYSVSQHAVVVVSSHIPSSGLPHEFVHVNQSSIDGHDQALLLLERDGRYTELMQNMLLKEAGATAVEVIELFQEARHKENFMEQMMIESVGGSHHAELVVELFRSLGEGTSTEADLGSKEDMAETKLLDRLMATYLAKGFGPHLQGYTAAYKRGAEENRQTNFDWTPAVFSDKAITEVALGSLYPDAAFPLTKQVLTDLGPILSASLRHDFVGEEIDVQDAKRRLEAIGNKIEASHRGTRVTSILKPLQVN